MRLRSAPVVVHAANDTPVRLADRDRNPTWRWVESMTTSIVYELRDDEVRMPASPGTQDDRAIECQKQIDFPIAEIGGLSHSLTEACNRVGKVYELINRWRAKDLNVSICAVN